MMRVVTSAINSKGKVVYLENELGRGGEGSVYAVRANSNAVAKIYHQAITSEKQDKIRMMVNMKSDSLLKFTTWPTDILTDAKGQVIGFLMPKLKGKEIHKLYGPKTRLLEFQNATYSFLIHTAANLARAFATVHENGHVIGDINHGNFYVSDQATVMLLDCDSFQIGTSNRLFKCEVGIPMYQPPELQEITSFRDLTRTQNHDNFGLALFIFLLLFMGRHPFAGRYLGPGEMPIEKAIKEYRFAYSSSAQGMLIQPPPGTIHMKTIPDQLTGLFERAFSKESLRGDTRPKPKEWIEALDRLSDNLIRCSHKEGHIFSSVNKGCPWCELEQKTGVVLFHATIFATSPVNSSFALHQIWKQILGVTSPGLPMKLPTLSSIRMEPDYKLVKQFKRSKTRRRFSAIPIFIGFVTLLAFPTAWFIIVVMTAIVTSTIYRADNSGLKQEFVKKRNEAQQRWDNISSRWLKEASDELFNQKKMRLEKAKQEYEGLDQLRAEKIKQLGVNQREVQLQSFLESHRIDDARIEGIGPSRKATLEAFGIETGLDVTVHTVRQVPGFGPTYTRKLLEWKNSIERKFVFNPKQGIPQSDIVNLDRDILAQRKKLEQELLSGPNQLLQIGNQIKARRSALWPEVEQAARELAQEISNIQYL
ncbi:helix-hairpin-helix domain-containing protein [Paenibacillus polymyxa]|uniref:helix-hairpin-helix domain-containing protein n=1 Tax=Paenibacillus polymyxa TaxID=1406 RepID=UPI0025B6A2C2|nr:hypothetical protein [Paenibacillus polymyxa]MDN4089595.1 hypothetical protein [Paenibacillus polymyxa]